MGREGKKKEWIRMERREEKRREGERREGNDGN